MFKQENLALRSAILRIRRIIENISKPENEDFKSDLFNGLKHQMTLLGQFHNHYTRKEKLFFPWESPFSFEVTDKSKHFTSWESPEIVTWEISILCKGNYVPEISCRHRTKLNICCQFK